MRITKLARELPTAVLALCAIIVTALLVRREFVQVHTPAVPSFIADWRNLLNGGRVTGGKDPSVYIIEFSDYECPYCGAMEPVLQKIIKKYEGRIGLVRYDFPLPSHPRAMDAALAAYCASDQGRYDSYHKLLFSNTNMIEQNDWIGLAILAGIGDTSRFCGCMERKDGLAFIQREIETARSIGIYATPTFVVNGHVLIGSMDGVQLDNAVSRALREINRKK